MSEIEKQKREAAAKALTFVESGMRLGLGTGSTAKHFVELLAERVRGGLKIIGVPTSEATRLQALAEGVPLTTLDETPQLDITIDGADEIDPALRLIKGGGAALLREKIVASASKRMIVIADQSKLVPALGSFRLPIEVNTFGLTATKLAVERTLASCGINIETILRKKADGHNLITDGGHMILDAPCGRIDDAERLSAALFQVPGVVEHGLFLNLASLAVIASENGARLVEATG